MYVDYIASRRAGIKFIFTEYGYSYKNKNTFSKSKSLRNYSSL